MIQEGHQSRLQQLFALDGNGSLSYFYASNKIIANPSVMIDILRDFPDLSPFEQQKLLTQITSMLQQVSTNSYCLNRLQQPTIIQLLIDLIPNYVDNYLIFNKMLDILDRLLKMSSTDQKLVQKAIQKLIVEFHAQNGEQMESKSLFATISILKEFFNCKIGMDKEPEKMIVFHGGNGLQIRPMGKKQINWMFSNGVSVYFWLNIENIKFGTETSLPKLFTFYSPNNGGLQCYLIDNKIYYRTVGSKYNSPKIGSNGICLGEIESKKWNFIGIQHQGPKRILGRSQIVFRINDKKVSFNLSPPSISSKQKLKMVFFDKIYCKTSSICVLPHFIENDFAEQLNKNKNSIDLLKNSKAYIFEQRQGKLYERSELGFCPDPVLHRHKEMNFDHILPLFHIFKFTKSPTQYPILNELLSLFVLFLYKSPANQIEAHNKNYPHVMAQLIKSLPNLEEKFNEQTVNTLLHIKQTITNSDLLAQYHGQFLWAFIDSKISMANKQVLLEIIKNNFTQSVSYFSNIIGLDQMLNAIIKLSTKLNRCCEKHYKIMLSRFQKEIVEDGTIIFGDNELALDYILKIIELYIQNEKVNSAQQIYKLCRVLSLKFSPCFTLSFMGLIKRILNQKLNQKLNSNQARKILQYLMSKKIYLIFLHVIENTFFAEIKAQSARIIYSVLLRKANAAEQQEISHRLSNALWKINEDHDREGRASSKHTSPLKIKSPEKIAQNQNQIIQIDQESSILEMKKKLSKGPNLLKISSLSEDQESGNQSIGNKNKASSIFKQVGPQAPQLTNKSKAGKTFSFSFMSDPTQKQQSKPSSAKEISFDNPFADFSSKIQKRKAKKEILINAVHDQIMEEEKTNENEISESIQNLPYQLEFKSQSAIESSSTSQISNGNQNPSKKKIRNLGLNINTDAINEMFTYGGERGQQIIISEEAKEAEIKKIRKLARICVAAMRGQKYVVESEENIENQKKVTKLRLPPMTTSNRLLKARQQPKLQELKLIDEQSEPESAMKSPPNANLKFINTSIPSPNFGSKKSKSPTSINSISQQNFIVLYNSLMESCITLPNYELVMPSIMYIFFSWIPQTNLEVKFLFDLSLILENDQSKQQIRALVKMPELYDFLFELTYKGLLFEQLGEKRLYMEKLQEIIKRIFAFIFREEPESIDKFSFIMDWATNKANQYHAKCLLLMTRYIYFLIMDAIEQDLFTNSKNDKLMQRNFQYLGTIINKFCKFLPIEQSNDSDCGVFVDQYDRVIFSESFEMLASLAPYFTTQWMDYLICEKYFILFKKFFCTDWYSKNLKAFQIYIKNGSVLPVENVIINALSTQALVLNAESQYYLKNSFIFTLIDINRSLFVEKILKSERQCIEKAQIIWQTILILLFAQSTKEKNPKNNSEFTTVFLKNCKVFCSLQAEKASIIVHLLKCITDTVTQNNMNSSGLYEGKQKEPKNQTAIKSAPFVESLIQNYINENLFEGQNSLNFENFKLNFRQVWIPGESHETQIKSDLYTKFIERIHKLEEKAPDYLEELSTLMEEQTERASHTQILIEAADREARSIFRKLWKNLRVFGSPWTHPDLTLQNDTLFNKNLFTYERFEASQFYKFRICKHMSKYRLRYLLKPILFLQPSISPQSSDKITDKEEIGLNKALLYYNENKLLLGWRIMSWIFPKHTAPNSNTGQTGNTFKQLQILMPFKKVRLIKTLTVRHGFLGIINDKLIFINAYYKEPLSHLSIAEYKLKSDKSFCKLWPLQWIKELFNKRYVNRKRAIEVCFIHGKSLMFQFYENDHEDFVKKIVKFKTSRCPNLIYNGNKSLDPKKIYQSQGLYKKWSTYEITNFEYLMEINNLAGRSYCDLTQYPVIPWILINFGPKLVMSDDNNFRNLALPMGAMGSEQRTEGFRERYEHMGEIQEERFHYGTHYSSPGIIYHFLVRLSPFTQGSILLQSGKFDFADRLFFSIMDSYKNATFQYSDVRELIPQMYTIPEVYLNINKWDLGVMQNQKRVHNVELPPWSRQNPYLYVTKLRKALQELYVSKNIGKWIDLIFGFKQKGQEAVKNLNCFVHLTYEDSIKFQQIKDDKTAKAIQTQILNFGQTPSQLFTKPHPQRASPNTLQIPGTICDPNVQPRIYRPSRHATNVDLLKDNEKEQFNAMKQSPQSIIHMRWFKDSRLVFIRKNGQMQFYKWHSGQPSTNKVPFQCAIEKEKIITRLSKNTPENMEYFDPSLKVDSFPIEFINNGHHIALGGISDGKLLLIDVDNNVVSQTYTAHSYTICCIRSDLKDNFLITGDISGHIIVWRIINNHRLNFYNEMKDHSQQITSIFISYDLRCLFTSSMDGSVFGYNIITNRKMKVFYHPKRLPINYVIVSTSPLPVIVLFCNVESIIYCYSINGQLIQRVNEKQIQHFLSPILIKDTLGFEHVVYGNEHGDATFRALPFLDNLTKHVVAKDAAVNRVCLSKSSKFVIVGCSDGELSVITAPDQQSGPTAR